MLKVREDLGTLIGDSESLIKDGLRGVRHVLRRGGVRVVGSAEVLTPVSDIARRVDGALSRAERKALALLRGGTGQMTADRLIANFGNLFGLDDLELNRRLVETQYRLIKAALGHWGLATTFVSEQEIRVALQILDHRTPQFLAEARQAHRYGDDTERTRCAMTFSVAAALAVAARQPVRWTGANGAIGQGQIVPAFLTKDPSRAACFCASLALSGYALHSSGESDPAIGGSGPADFLASAAAIVEARYGDLAQSHTIAELTREFQRVIAAMP